VSLDWFRPLWRRAKAVVVKPTPLEWIEMRKAKYLMGNVIEGTGTIQCVCPICPYGTGSNEPFLASVTIPAVVRCLRCHTIFIGFTTGHAVDRHTQLIEVYKV
jgi:hypothetical protein